MDMAIRYECFNTLRLCICPSEVYCVTGKFLTSLCSFKKNLSLNIDDPGKECLNGCETQKAIKYYFKLFLEYERHHHYKFKNGKTFWFWLIFLNFLPNQKIIIFKYIIFVQFWLHIKLSCELKFWTKFYVKFCFSLRHSKTIFYIH